VLVPGVLNEQKGARVLFSVAEAARRRKLPLEFRIVGFAREAALARRAGIRSTGRFEPGDADRALARQARAPCLVWLPSVAPETWSATLSSALRLGLFPVSFDLGALAERIEGAGQGATLPLALADDPDGLADALLALRDAPGTRPAPGPIEASLRTDRDRAWQPATLRPRSEQAEPGRPAVRSTVILDRDGVLNRDRDDFVCSLADWSPIPGSLEAVARLSRAGFRVVVVTNQSGLARGLISQSDLDAIHARLRAQVEALGGAIDGLLFCPHSPDEGCACRKPLTGLVEKAARTLGFEPREALVVGDRRSDAELGLALGARAVLVETGKDLPVESDPLWERVGRAPDLATLVERELAR